MVLGNVFPFHELEAVELTGNVKGSLENVFEFEVRTEGLFIQVILGLADLLGVIPPVPGLELEARVVLLPEGFPFGGFLQSLATSGFPDLAEEGVDLIGVLGHVLGQGVVGEGGEAQDVGLIDPQVGDLHEDGLVVEGIVVVSLFEVAPVKLLPEVPPVRVGQEGEQTGFVEGEDPFSGQAPLLSGFGGSGDHSLRQTGQLLPLVQNHLKGVVLGQDVVAELELQQAQLFVDLAEAVLHLLGKGGAVPEEPLVVDLGEPFLLRGETLLLPVLVNPLDPLEEPLVQQDVVAVLGEKGGDLGGYGLHLLVGHRFGEDEEDAGDALQKRAALLQRLNGVGEGRGSGAFRYGLDLSLILIDSGPEGGHIVFHLDLFEGWDTEGGLELLKERVRGFRRSGRQGQGSAEKHGQCDKNFFHLLLSLFK